MISILDTPADWLDNLLKDKLLQSGLELGPEEDIRSSFIYCGFNYLYGCTGLQRNDILS